MAKKKELTEEDWARAEEYLHEVEQRYLDLMNVPGVNVMGFFNLTLPPIRGAWNKGIRDQDLYDRIMALE